MLKKLHPTSQKFSKKIYLSHSHHPSPFKDMHEHQRTFITFYPESSLGCIRFSIFFFPYKCDVNDSTLNFNINGIHHKLFFDPIKSKWQYWLTCSFRDGDNEKKINNFLHEKRNFCVLKKIVTNSYQIIQAFVEWTKCQTDAELICFLIFINAIEKLLIGESAFVNLA